MGARTKNGAVVRAEDAAYLTEAETRIAALIYKVEIGGMEIAAVLHEIEESGAWRWKPGPDGRYPMSFKDYLDFLAAELRDSNIRASRATFERLLSFYRIYHLELGMELRTIMRVGVGNLDRIRSIIDWNHRTGRIGPGTDEKMGLEEARRYMRRLAEEVERDGGIPMEAIESDVNGRRGIEPLRITLQVRRGRDRLYLNDLVVWRGGTAYRLREGVPEEVMNWFITRTRGSVTWLETS